MEAAAPRREMQELELEPEQSVGPSGLELGLELGLGLGRRSGWQNPED